MKGKLASCQSDDHLNSDDRSWIMKTHNGKRSNIETSEFGRGRDPVLDSVFASCNV